MLHDELLKWQSHQIFQLEFTKITQRYSGRSMLTISRGLTIYSLSITTMFSEDSVWLVYDEKSNIWHTWIIFITIGGNTLDIYPCTGYRPYNCDWISFWQNYLNFLCFFFSWTCWWGRWEMKSMITETIFRDLLKGKEKLCRLMSPKNLFLILAHITCWILPVYWVWNG